jgi:diguanylate cyclase (GGDEF)-like protein
MKAQLALVRQMRLGFLAVIVVLLVVGNVAYRSVIGATEASLWSEHTRQVLEHIERLRLAMENVESGYRDYAFSGDETFLQLSRVNIPLVDQERGFLRALTTDNPDQQHRLDAVDNLAQQIIRRGNTFIRLRESGGADAPADVIPKGQVDPILAEFRAVAAGMTGEESRLLKIRDEAARKSYGQTRVALLAGSALALLIAALSGWRVPSEYTRRTGAEHELRRLNRLYAMVGGINALGIRARDRDDLFTNACRIAVEDGEFEMAWIGVVDPSQTRIVPIASAGIDETTWAAIKDLFSGSEGTLQGRTLSARSIREKTAVVSNDVSNDETLLFGKIYAEGGVRSIAMLPLIVSGSAIGVFVLYTTKLEFFDSPGLTLLTELASNIAFAIDHIEKQERLDRFAYYDVLTGLANRSLFLDRLTQHMLSAVIAGQRVAVFLIDLERFKKFNDKLGRPAGDALLKQVAEWLEQNAGSINALARVGPDHFALVLPEVTYEGDVAQQLEVIIAAFLIHPFIVDDVAYRIAARVGVAVFPEDGTDADTLFKNAEGALKKAKVGRDRYLFYAQKMTETLAGSLSIENRLRLALERQEFVLHYQPKVSLVSGRLTGAEALIRWNDPDNGLVPPARFISVLEESGLIHEVGRWALHRAIEDHLRWRRAGFAAPPRIAVNVSPLQLRNQKFVAEIEAAVRTAPNAAAGLELEITESLIMENVEHSIVSLLAIRALGITIAIDDFGTGFSSLSYLSKLPVDTLKIDRSFVVDMTAGSAGTTLVSAIIDLAHAMRLKVVAEGVETEEQLRQLRLLHCDEMQGYLFGKPVPCAIFEQKYLSPFSAGTRELRLRELEGAVPETAWPM